MQFSICDRLFSRIDRIGTYRRAVQLRSDATQEMHIHVMQVPNLKARMDRLGEFIVNSGYFNLRKRFLL